MKKTLTSALIAAGLLAMGAAAQAQTTYYYSTQTYPSYSYSYSVPVQPAVVATTPSYSYSYSYPYGTSYSYSYSYPYGYQAPSVVPYSTYQGTSASVTTDVPTRAGEATTYTNGAPNLLAQNWGYSTYGTPYTYYYPY